MLYIVLAGLASGNLIGFLIVMILPGSIVLHSYAALQLRKSILNPQIPLGQQTPTGIRFLGFIVILMGCLSVYNSLSLFNNPDEFVKQMKQMPQAANLDLKKVLRGATIFGLVFSISVIANALINFRLLKWYQMETEE